MRLPSKTSETIHGVKIAGKKRRRCFWTIICLGVPFFFLFAGSIFSLGIEECCSRCGIRKSESFIFDKKVFQKLHATALSKSAAVTDLVPTHEHEWKFVHGCGQGLSCMIGEGRHIVGITENADFAATLDRIHQSFGAAESRRVLEAALNPKMSDRVVSTFSLTPEEPSMSEASFRFWCANRWIYLDRLR